MGIAEEVAGLVAPLLADLGLSLYDCEHHGGTVRVTVDRPGGVDLETLSLATRVVSRELDHADPIPGRYTLEVTSPGLERALRTPAHFRASLGATVSVRTRPGIEPRRVQGMLREADDDGIVVVAAEGDLAEVRLAYADVERARTVFTWGGAPKPGGPKPRTKASPAATAEAVTAPREAGA
jgi:ribosome maturation factor RimP